MVGKKPCSHLNSSSKWCKWLTRPDSLSGSTGFEKEQKWDVLPGNEWVYSCVEIHLGRWCQILGIWSNWQLRDLGAWSLWQSFLGRCPLQSPPTCTCIQLPKLGWCHCSTLCRIGEKKIHEDSTWVVTKGNDLELQVSYIIILVYLNKILIYIYVRWTFGVYYAPHRFH